MRVKKGECNEEARFRALSSELVSIEGNVRKKKEETGGRLEVQHSFLIPEDCPG